MPNAKNTDHLANERTFLAYIRTALAFIAFGFVIARFSLFTREISSIAHISVPSTHASAEFGVGMALAGILIGVYGAIRFAGMSSAIAKNESRPMPLWAAITSSAFIVAVGVVVAIALFEVR